MLLFVDIHRLTANIIKMGKHWQDFPTRLIYILYICQRGRRKWDVEFRQMGKHKNKFCEGTVRDKII